MNDRGDRSDHAAPLAGLRVLVPRAAAQAGALSQRVRVLGGIPVEAPVLVIEPGDDGALRAAVRDLADGRFVGVCLTSPNGVDALAAALDAEGHDARALGGGARIACVGSGTTARLWDQLRVRADLVPPQATVASLAEAMPPGTGPVLLPRADLANPILGEVLAVKGYEPVEVTAYRTGTPDELPEPVLAELAAGRVDLVAFASSSTVRNFHQLLTGRSWRARVVSIGPVTSATCRELGIEVAVEADPHDLDGLEAALVRAATREH